MATADNTEKLPTHEEIEEELSSFGAIGGVRAFKVQQGISRDEADDFTRCVTEYLKNSMYDAVENSGLKSAEAWVNALLIEMIDALGYVVRKEAHPGRQKPLHPASGAIT